MRTLAGYCIVIALAGCSFSCGTSRESSAVASKEMLYRRGHQLYLQQQFDSAAVLLQRSVAMDSSYRDPVADLAELYYDVGMSDSTPSPGRTRYLRQSRDSYVWLDLHGEPDAIRYDRLCSVAQALGDQQTMIAYAKKNAEQYPFDRQHYNLGIAFFTVGDVDNSIRILKDAVKKFRSSEFIGGMYRQLGRSYMAVDRNQTAERVYYEGLGVIDNRLKDLAGKDQARTRLREDRMGILTSLKGLHTLYKQAEKLKQVELLLQEAGHSR